jgi:hypothetical protein
MSKRERTLAVCIGIMAVAFGGKQFVWPMVDGALFQVKRENDSLRAEVAELDSRLDDIIPIQKRFHSFLMRTGASDVDKVQGEFHAKLTQLIDQVGLMNPRVTPRRPTEYRPPDRRVKNSGIKQIRFTVTGEGRMPAIVNFLKGFYELPYIARATNVSLNPVSTRGVGAGEVVKMTVSVEALVPPVDPLGEVSVDSADRLTHFVKHTNRDFAAIATRDFFKEYVPPPKKWACCTGGGRCQELTVEQCASRGGSSFEARLCAQVRNVETACTPPVACCVEDRCVEVPRSECLSQGGDIQLGKSSCRGVKCEEADPDQDSDSEPVVVDRTPRPPPPPPGDPDRDEKVIRMVLDYGTAESSIAEVLVVNTRSNVAEYVGIGDQLDGGEVLLVHPLGAASRRSDGSTRVYPVGRLLKDCVSIEDVVNEYPEIAFAYESYESKIRASAPQEVGDAGDSASGEGADGSGTGSPARRSQGQPEPRDGNSKTRTVPRGEGAARDPKAEPERATSPRSGVSTEVPGAAKSNAADPRVQPTGNPGGAVQLPLRGVTPTGQPMPTRKPTLTSGSKAADKAKATNRPKATSKSSVSQNGADLPEVTGGKKPAAKVEPSSDRNNQSRKAGEKDPARETGRADKSEKTPGGSGSKLKSAPVTQKNPAGSPVTPSAKTPTAKKSTAAKTTTKKPTARKPTAKESAVKKSVAKRPIAKKSMAKKATDKTPIAKKPTVKRPGAKKPTAEKPTAKKSGAKKSTDKAPIAKKPIAKKPTVKTSGAKTSAEKKKSKEKVKPVASGGKKKKVQDKAGDKKKPSNGAKKTPPTKKPVPKKKTEGAGGKPAA